MNTFLLAIIGIPALEIYLFIKVGSQIGAEIGSQIGPQTYSFAPVL